MDKSNISNIITELRSELKKSVDIKYKQGYQKYFKESVKFYGVKSAQVGKIAKKYWTEVKDQPKKKVFQICETLLASDYCEEAFVVCSWVPKLKGQFVESDFAIFQKWISKYINNWAKCDTFCNHTMGDFIELYPSYISRLKVWATSKNIWVKRAAVVSLIIPAKSGKYLKDIFELSEILLTDPSDMVQKGYGWLLKEASREHQKEVLDFVISHKKIMPRTSLRYAIELMPNNLRKVAMAK